VEISERSMELITLEDLRRFANLTLSCLEAVYQRAPVAGMYKDRLLFLTLAQGGAQHFCDKTNGLKDIDIWAFYRGGLERPFPVRARWNVDMGPSKFGKHPDDVGYRGRRIDILGRSVEVKEGDQSNDAVARWLNGSSNSAIELRKRPLIFVYPDMLIGKQLIP